VTIRLKQGQTVVDTQVTGWDGYFLFSGVPAGTWQVWADLPAGYDVTTGVGNPAFVGVVDHPVIVSFGIALSPTATATPTVTQTATPTTKRQSSYLPLIVRP
jgi:hypothetical protein